MIEYLIALSAVAMIVLGTVVPYSQRLKTAFDEITSTLRNPPVVIISLKPGGSQQAVPPGSWTVPDGANQTEATHDGSSQDETDHDEQDSEAETELIETAGCGVWRDFDFGFFETQNMIQILVRGDRIGLYEVKGNPSKKGSQSIDLESVEALGGESSLYLLAIEYDGVNEYFTSHNRVSVFTLDGEKIVNRALVKYESPGDLRQGDEYLITHTQNFIIDIDGTTLGNTVYSEEGQAGRDDVGNNDNVLDFHDIGCVIYRPLLED